jgi:MFS family permease
MNKTFWESFMEKTQNKNYLIQFIPYALAAFLIGIIGGFTTILGPTFVKDLGIDYNNTTWTALAMAVSTATFAPILGKLGDVIGRRITLLIGLFVFIVGNIATALASSLVFMLIARFIVGVGSAAVAPVVIAYIVTQFPQDKVSKGFSLYMLISSAAVIFGPTLSGLIVNRWGWRMMTWVCVLLSVIIFFACLVLNKEKHTSRQTLTDFDWLGAIFVFVFFALALCLPSFAQNLGWNSMPFISVLVGAVISLLVLVFVEKKTKKPILQGGFMKRRAFIFSVAALFLTQGLMQANMTNVIVFVNYTQPNNSVISGYAISIMYLGMSLGSIFLGPLADKYEPKRILVASFSFTAIGCALMLLFSAKTSVILLALSLGVLGFGLGANATIFMRVVLFGVSAEKAGTATGTYGLFRDLAAPFGVAVFVPLFTNSTTNHIAAGLNETAAAVRSIHALTITELICIAVGILAVLFLPKIHKKKEVMYETDT